MTERVRCRQKPPLHEAPSSGAQRGIALDGSANMSTLLVCCFILCILQGRQTSTSQTQMSLALAWQGSPTCTRYPPAVRTEASRWMDTPSASALLVCSLSAR